MPLLRVRDGPLDGALHAAGLPVVPGVRVETDGVMSRMAGLAVGFAAGWWWRTRALPVLEGRMLAAETAWWLRCRA